MTRTVALVVVLAAIAMLVFDLLLRDFLGVFVVIPIAVAPPLRTALELPWVPFTPSLAGRHDSTARKRYQFGSRETNADGCGWRVEAVSPTVGIAGCL